MTNDNTLLGVAAPPERQPTRLVQGLPPFAELSDRQKELVTDWINDDDDLRSAEEIRHALRNA